MPRSGRLSSFSNVNLRVGQKLTTTYNSFRNFFAYQKNRRHIAHLEATMLLLQQKVDELIEEQTAHDARFDTLVQTVEKITQEHAQRQSNDMKGAYASNDVSVTHKRPRLSSIPESEENRRTRNKMSQTENTPEHTRTSEDTIQIAATVQEQLVDAGSTFSPTSKAQDERKDWFTLQHYFHQTHSQRTETTSL